MILGLDIGKRRIGVAKLHDDGDAQVVLPLTLIHYRKPGDALKQILQLTIKEKVSAYVLGYPLNPDGSKGEMAILVERWRLKLVEETGLQVHLCEWRKFRTRVDRMRLCRRGSVLDRVRALRAVEAARRTRRSPSARG